MGTQLQKAYDDAEELREKIKKAQFELAGRRATHIQVARKSGWTPSQLDEVHAGDQIIFENEIMSLIHSREIEARHDELDKVPLGDISAYPELIQYRIRRRAALYELQKLKEQTGGEGV